jgi:hypothetical protein
LVAAALQRRSSKYGLTQFGKKDEKEDKTENPGDSLMKMMKKMYDDGDDNMKRTIAEAWTKAQDKKGGGAGMDDFDMGGMGKGGKDSFPGFATKKK